MVQKGLKTLAWGLRQKWNPYYSLLVSNVIVKRDIQTPSISRWEKFLLLITVIVITRLDTRIPILILSGPEVFKKFIELSNFFDNVHYRLNKTFIQ